MKPKPSNMNSYDSGTRPENNVDDSLNSVISVHYPGVVKDVSKMLETLGGIKMISTIYSEKNRRLELRWRPDDSYCKPTFATKRPVVGLVLKIKFRKKKKEKTGTILSCEPIGSVTEEYKFCNLCDFQYLATSKDKCFYNAIVPQSLDPDWLNSEGPYFLPPAAFSRMDTVQNVNFSKVPLEGDKPNVIGRLRRKRYGCTQRVSFDNPEIPTLPKDIPLGGITSAKLVTSETLEHLKSERPIYSKSAIKCISKLSAIQLKCILPCVAYYFVNGPWRSLWVRFGYNPRNDPKARIYQTLDYRVRSHLSKEEVKNKRQTTGSLSFKFTSSSGKNTSVISRITSETREKEDEIEPEDYIFRPEVIPPSRQCYYQYCDIHIPEVKAMLENLEDIDESTVCHEVDGWLPPGMADTCRDIMNKYVSEEVKRRNKLSSHQSTSSLTLDTPNNLSSGSESDFTDSDE